MIRTLLLYSDPDLGEVRFRINSAAKRYIISLKNGKVNVTIPWRGSLERGKDFFAENRGKIGNYIREREKREASRAGQTAISDIVSLAERANTSLPAMLRELAESHGFSYKVCKIGKSRSAWGSCSTSGTIILSIYLMLLPVHLIEYVLLHELCHTVHPSHNSDFWELLDRHTGGRARILRKELRNYFMPPI